MSNKKQSSIEWLYNTIDYEIVSYLDGEIDLNELSIAMLKIKEQAKEMHKEEIAKTWDDSLDNLKARGMNEMRAYTDFDEYYTKTFGGQDNE